MERLLVDRIDRHLRRAEQLGVVERADLDDQRPRHRRAGDQVGAALGAELARDRTLEIAALELLGRPLGVTETVSRHQQEHVGRAAGDVLAFAAMALRLHDGLAVDLIADLTAIAPASEFHGPLPTTAERTTGRCRSGPAHASARRPT